MPSTEQILAAISEEEKPIHRKQLADKLGESSYRNFQTLLNRAQEAGLVTVSGDHEYSITDNGIAKLSEKSKEDVSEEGLGTTEYQKFISLGKALGGNPPELIKQTAEHIWNGGNFGDLEWVATGLQQMGIRSDIRNRWWHAWRSYLHQPIPGELPASLSEKTSSGEKESTKDGKEKGSRSYILTDDDQPLFVGTGHGDLDYQDAVDLARVRAIRSRNSAGAQGSTSMVSEVATLFGIFKEIMGDHGETVAGKSWVVSPGENGIEVSEVEQGKPLIINSSQSAKQEQTKTYFVNSSGEMSEALPGQPIIIKQPAPVSGGQGVQYLIDKSTGTYEEIKPGQPIIIQSSPPQSQYPYSPIQMKDSEGNPITLDLSTYIRLDEHKEKMRRDEESHETKMQIAKGFKDLLTRVGNALTHASEE